MDWNKLPWTSFILHTKLWIISRGVSGLATDSTCGLWGRGWTTCLLYGSSLFNVCLLFYSASQTIFVAQNGGYLGFCVRCWYLYHVGVWMMNHDQVTVNEMKNHAIHIVIALRHSVCLSVTNMTKFSSFARLTSTIFFNKSACAMAAHLTTTLTRLLWSIYTSYALQFLSIWFAVPSGTNIWQIPPMFRVHYTQ